MLAAPFLVPGKNSTLFFLLLTFLALPEWIRAQASLSTYLYGTHQVVLALHLLLLGKISSQQCIFPKEASIGIPKYLFLPSTKPHPRNPLAVGPPFLYWLGTSGWCSGPCVCVPLSFAFVFFYSHAIFAVLAMSHFAMCLLCSCLSSTTWRGAACTISSYFPMGLDIGLAKVPAYLVYWAFALVTSLLARPMGLLAIIPTTLAHWAFYLFP